MDIIWWSSSDENGVVTAIGAGEATITATTADGSNLSTTCKVVIKLLIPEVGTTFEYENLKYEVTVAGKEVAVKGLIDSSYSGEIIIPESVIFNGITYSVTSIGEYAFIRCIGLSSIECLAEVPPTIEEYTFENYSCEWFVPTDCK